ncbi:TATA element modulatory factor [Escovopsis weberi]|uniref:TATA element modulatory factor n=1 Tax=Escovopsis weberi TaxID=150374 RepID=A0A0M8MXK0_ESCWE|nr:TATA element modulatory factor [Escovopsis weberi]
MAARWGSLLSQAVAGVESRLDNILAESDENGGAGPAGAAQAAAPAKPAAQSGETGQGDGEQGRDAEELERYCGTGELEEMKAHHQAEIQEYVERIDSLQSKLQYMSRNAADAAKKTASSAAAGSAERKLAEQDERISLLIEEGQKLASAEQQYRATIKRLRLQLAEKDKQMVNVEHDKAKATAEAQALRSRLSSDEEKEKRQQETLRVTAALQREVDGLKRDKLSKDEAMRRLEQETKLKVEQAAAAHADALKKAVSVEEEKQKELENKKAALAAELESTRERSRQDEIEWGEKLERAIERGRAVEGELRAELKTMEGKLEGMRAAAEEATSGSGGEAQVKLLRQIETLQSQYASARENWQGIEASLLAKAGGLEKERDEAQRRESEMRKRARDAVGQSAYGLMVLQASRCRTLEDELQDAQPALATAQKELDTCREQLAALRASSKASEAALEQLRAELEKEKRSTIQELSAEAERRQWAEGVAGSLGRNHSRPVSPMLSISRAMNSDMIGLPFTGRPSRRVATPGSVSDSPQMTEGGGGGGPAGGRRPPPLNQQPLRSATLSTISTTDSSSLHMPSSVSPFEPPAEVARLTSPPPSAATHRENNGADDPAPSSPRGLAQDMVSVCTVAAGPSVQLVERMSAAIRRLEGEKVTAREEMARVCAQRDEARGDIAALMRDLEEARAAAERGPDLQRQVDELDARYQTTLELLGEKSELVDELRADVEDVKAMYRELVERAVK